MKQEPKLQTPTRLNDILDELIAREPIFHHPVLGRSREALENMTDPDFWEVGASGNRYSREYVIKTLLERYKNDQTPDIWEIKDPHCLEIAPNNYLLTYTLIQDNSRVTRRSTIWRKTDGNWKILYHQGTVFEG